ncbi:hypothetical protein BYT27DRAFT_7215799 [Phlegmacium glaucopus]|nr:hypothetical protein BYT27DRAFT_7215799 [Phlegmacium glaucopus]
MQLEPAPAPVPQQLLVAGPSKRELAQPDKGKGKMVAPVEDTEDEESEEDQAKVWPPPSKAQREPSRQDKGKQKMAVPVEEQEDLEEGDDESEEEEGDEESEEQPRAKVLPPASQGEKKRATPKTNGQRQNPACRRCVKSQRTCLEQAGFATACVWCTTVKMRCDPVGDEEEQQVEAKGPSRNRHQHQLGNQLRKSAGPSKKLALAPTPKPALTSGLAPAPKSRHAPAAVSKKKKKVVKSSDKEASDAGTWHPQNRTFGDLERQDNIEELTFLVSDFQNELIACLKDVGTLEDRMDNAFILMDTWVMKNVEVEGEVMALSRRVEAQDAEMEDLRERLTQAEELLTAFSETASQREQALALLVPVAPRHVTLPAFPPPILAPTSPAPKSGLHPVLHVEVPAAQPVPVPVVEEILAAQPMPAVHHMPVDHLVPASQPTLDTGSHPASSAPTLVAEVPPPVPGPVLAPEEVSASHPVSPLPSSRLPPPGLQVTSQASVDMPSVHLLPPTPNTSQEAVNYAPTTLLQVTGPSEMPISPQHPQTASGSRSRSRSRSPAIEASNLRWSPCLASSKHLPDDSLDELAAKKQRLE